MSGLERVVARMRAESMGIEPNVIVRGVGTGTGPESILWGEPEMGSLTPEDWARALLVTEPGRALAALVDAAVAWHRLGLLRYGETEDRELYTAVDAYLAAARDAE